MQFKVDTKKFIIALGAETKNTVAYTKDGTLHVSESFGNTFYMENLKNHRKYVERLLEEHGQPDLLLIDQHPNYNVSNFGRELGLKYEIHVAEVQHHLAHLYSVALEHKLKDFLGFAADGTGYGNNQAWGGELFKNTERIGHLEEHKLLGGEAAIKKPAKMLYSIANKFLKGKELEDFMLNYLTKEELKMISKQEDYFITTSTGRVFDATSIMLGFTDHKDENNDPAVILSNYACQEAELIEPVIKDNILTTTPVFEWLYKNRLKDKSLLASSFVMYMAQGIWKLLSSNSSSNLIFSGGVAYNKTIRQYLEEKGVKFNIKLPYGDENISAGQAYYFLTD